MKFKHITFFTILLNLFVIAHCTNMSDYLIDLPGWDKEKFTSVYGGHLAVKNNSKFLTFMFFESTNSYNENTPVVLWMQGGPGASGFMGLFTELGPFNLNQNSFNGDETPKLIYNPHSWTNNAHFLFIESPAGLGYTYCAGDCPVNTDESAAEDAYDLLIEFFKKFDKFATNPFFIAGESYGGIYVPMLAEQIVDNTNKINLKGIIVGNGCTGTSSIGGCGPDSKMTLTEFLHGHGQISTKSFQNVQKMCKTDMNSSDCNSATKTAISEAGEFFEYNVYDECEAYEANKDESPSPQYDYPCFQDQALYKYMTSPEIKNIFTDKNDWITFDGYWDLYISTKDDVLPIYQKLMDNQIPILIFYGDIDAGVPYNGGQKWIRSLNLQKVNERRPWTLDGNTEVAGYITEYENNFTYVTVRGAGHMVPRYKPEAALLMFESFVFNWPLPLYIEQQ